MVVDKNWVERSKGYFSQSINDQKNTFGYKLIDNNDLHRKYVLPLIN